MKNLFLLSLSLILILISKQVFSQGSYNMCDTSFTSDTTGTLYDSGGPNGVYQVNEDCSFLIAPSNQTIITLSFQFFSTETTFDSLYVYDGTTIHDPLLLAASGHTIPASVTAFSGNILLVWHSDISIVDSGFACTWITAACPCSTISGKIFNDINSNCTYDAGEELSHVPVKADNGQIILWRNTDSTGSYLINVPTGYNYDVTVSNTSGFNSRYIPSCPSSGTIAVTSLPSTGNDFALTCPNGFDLTGNISAWGIRPASNAYIFVFGYNQRCNTPTGQIQVILDTNVSILPDTNAIYTVSGDTVTYPINPGEYSWRFTIPIFVSQFSQIGDSVCGQFSISPVLGDSVPGNNIQTFCLPINNSWDPNEKSVAPEGISPQGYILPDTRLTYTIFFQNTGSADAINIHVIDTLSSNLDPSTIEVVGTSHDMTWSMLAGNILRFDYPNIYLPDSISNEQGSHGYVMYKISPYNNLQQFAEIRNSASIYFDFNSPVNTNTTVNTIDMSLSTGQVISGSITSVYPNPANVNCNLIFKDDRLRNISVLDLTGKIIFTTYSSLSLFSLNTENIENGIYTIRINDGKENNFCKLIIQH